MSPLPAFGMYGVTPRRRPALVPEEVSGEEIPGVYVESDVAGTGEAVNAEAGEVTQPGEPLPPISSEGPGEALSGSGGTETPAGPSEDAGRPTEALGDVQFVEISNPPHEE